MGTGLALLHRARILAAEFSRVEARVTLIPYPTDMPGRVATESG